MRWRVWVRALGAAAGAVMLVLVFFVLGLFSARLLIDLFSMVQ
jgi:hypothetical protein